jgi:hypothetical protein
MTFGFPELAAIRLGYGLSPLMPPPENVEAVLSGPAKAGPGPDAMTTARASALMVRLRARRVVRKTSKNPRISTARWAG